MPVDMAIKDRTNGVIDGPTTNELKEADITPVGLPGTLKRVAFKPSRARRNFAIHPQLNRLELPAQEEEKNEVVSHGLNSCHHREHRSRWKLHTIDNT